MSTEHLFVYGTLRRGSRHRMQRLLEQNAEFVDRATFAGKLYLVARYPGAVASKDADDRVVGDVFALGRGRRDPSALLRQLDRYEGFTPGDTQALFIRERGAVTLSSGAELDAWIYLYNGPTAGMRRIVSGDFFGATHRMRDTRER
ncbi:MAG: gamma-glutamylcyclotransferase family protein [Gammaproteobacteria bacterium]|nr:gamma-glutamylcyclotransferase family protein [Gammaproteobacteria bacterium]